ncbi:MAG TPA: phytanoyl-CoA dioxygenase family protein [Actinocrinis sp.]|uniref:phytanoyl-CoA dioxygenase family protein n=1 Tax=Actinocrinis sp. TaxID=1920516 RepID=UPI002DDD0851|nr:phytanoyl-CoA dioxygenase family protein [Actinocrinis sp.]HEV2342856.1 phytanoyl-CoA dioxygenase family protein [Actinocrinis sp.]
MLNQVGETTPDPRYAALPPAQLRAVPSANDARFFAEHGWWLSAEPLFSDDEIDALLEASDKYYAGQRDRQLPVRPPFLASWAPEDGPVQRHNDYVHFESDAIRAILCKPLLGATAAALAAAEAVRVWQATMIYKPPNPAEATNLVPWHMDRHYWQTCSSERMLTAFIPLHDCTVEMGTIEMIDGSHLWSEIDGDDSTRHFAQRNRDELEQILQQTAELNGTAIKREPVVIPRGHVSFHHCRTYHGSGANVSGRPRRAISLHLQDGENRYRRFERPDGSTVVYNHDVLVRRTAEGVPDYADPEYCPQIWPAAS